ncbi:Gx transporter family protein [Evtepia sp.]|uniref:Gx transporter family protein n=1 Tax=Evtepia sp. TaxID=2773933 RepID=UPI003F16B182
MNVKKLTYMAMLTAISMIVFLIEAQIPLPFAIPGVKLGIANVITLYAIWTLGWKEAGAILIIRIFLGNVIAGNVMAMAYSLAGGLLCWVIMSLLKPIMKRSQIWIMSILGAIGHNAGQLAVAIAISGTAAMAWYAPVLLVAGVITGAFTGYLTQILLSHMDKLKTN